MGSLGFLLPFHVDAMPRVLEQTLTGPVTLLNRLRLAVKPFNADGSVLDRGLRVPREGWQVMNEVTLHRGRHGHLCRVDTFFDGQHLTEAVVSYRVFSQLTPGGRTARFDTNRIHCLLPFSRRAHLSSRCGRSAVDAHSAKIVVFPHSSSSWAGNSPTRGTVVSRSLLTSDQPALSISGRTVH